jgi:hypothetical protein
MRALALTIFVYSLLVASADAQTDTAAARQVLATEDQRFAAMLRGDSTALRSLVADELTYTHTDGEHQLKADFLRTVGSGAIRYEAIAPDHRTVRVVGEGGIVGGESAMRVGPPGQIRAFRIRYLAVYVHRSGTWQLLAWQSTRLPG